MYNKQDPFVMHNVKEYTFKEKVKVEALLLAVSVSLSSCGIEKEKPQEEPLLLESSKEIETSNLETTKKIEIDNWELEVGEEEIVVADDSTKNSQYIAIKFLDELDEYFKSLAHNLAVAIYENNPDADLRVYYYHLKNLEAEAMSEEEYEEKFQDYSGATYNSKENKFYL